VHSGSFDYVFANGTGDASILSGGTQTVLGTTTSAIVDAGTQVVEPGGVASATALSGGFEDILAGGLATSTTITGSGYQYAFSGGIASGTVLSGGTFELASGASIGGGAIAFSGGGMLMLDDAVGFGGLVAGFGGGALLDLGNVPFVASGSSATTLTWMQLTSGATASGSLMVGDGTSATTANITLLGAYMAGNFAIQSDGRGGTLVIDPPLAATDPGPFALVAAHQA
jgi:autotransporter passenger strand-loop-strand repeat protein